MQKLEKISDTLYRYACDCGQEITFHTDINPGKIHRCFRCQEKFDLGLLTKEKKNE